MISKRIRRKTCTWFWLKLLKAAASTLEHALATFLRKALPFRSRELSSTN